MEGCSSNFGATHVTRTIQMAGEGQYTHPSPDAQGEGACPGELI